MSFLCEIAGLAIQCTHLENELALIGRGVGPGVLEEGRDGLRVRQEVLGVVAPFLDDGLLHPAGVGLHVDAHLFGDLDAVGLLGEPESIIIINLIQICLDDAPISQSL